MRLLPPVPRRIVAAALVAAAGGLSGCASGGRARVMTHEESARVEESWERLAGRAASGGAIRLLYEARLSGPGISLSGSLAVHDRPGRAFTAAFSDDFGLRILAATWDGGDLRFDEDSSSGSSAAAEWRRRFSGAISPRILSFLFIGIPDDAAPDSIVGVGDGYSLFWAGAGIRCDMDPESGRPRRAFFGRQGERVEVSLSFGTDDVPSSLLIDAQKGGRVTLRLVSNERDSP